MFVPCCRHEDPLDSKAIAAAQRQRPSRYPPITPNACAKNDIENAIFDDIWTVLADCMRILLQRYSEHFVITHPMAIDPCPEDENAVHGPFKLPLIELNGGSNRSANATNLTAHNHNRSLPGHLLSRPGPYVTPPPNHRENLGQLLFISKKEVLERKGTFV